MECGKRCSEKVMENPTGFDVKRATDLWRQSLQHLSLSDADIAEVETHFIDSMTALEAKGLSPEESFLVAKHRIGPAERIDREFRKIKPDLLWLRRACWIVFGALLAPAVSADALARWAAHRSGRHRASSS